MQGTIKRLIRERGFGFIRSLGQQVFFHRSNLQGLNFDDLQEGQHVQFVVERGEKSLQIVNVGESRPIPAGFRLAGIGRGDLPIHLAWTLTLQ